MSEVGKTYDNLAEAYDDYHVDGKSLAENRHIARYLRQYIAPTDVVIDLGCGTGLLLDLVQLPPERYVGLDISEGMLESARKKHPGYRFVQGDLQVPIQGLEEDNFTLAISLFGSPSYCPLEPVVSNVRSLLQPKGRYFLMYCGPKYLSRSTYINRERVLLMPRAAAELQAAYPGAHIWGMSSLVDRLPTSSPSALLDLALKFDVAVMDKVAKDACFFLNVEGTR